MKKLLSLLFTVIVVLYNFTSCKNDSAALLYPPDACDSVNVTYSGTILPILRDNCYRCHAGSQTVAPFHLDAYADASLVALSGHMVGALTHSPGFSPMPKNAAQLSDCTIGKIRKW